VFADTLAKAEAPHVAVCIPAESSAVACCSDQLQIAFQDGKLEFDGKLERSHAGPSW